MKEILYNISVPESLNPYAIGNLLYFPVNGYNINSNLLKGVERSFSSGFTGSGLNLPLLPQWTVHVSTSLDFFSSLAGDIETLILKNRLLVRHLLIFIMHRTEYYNMIH